jgi:hypothetical protein
LDVFSVLFFLILLATVAVTYLSNLKGKFNKLNKTHFLFAGLATGLPFVDMAQTFLALEHGAEGNPLLLYFLTGFPEQLGPALFVSVHVAFCALGFYTGLKGKNESAVDSRTLTAFLGILWTIVVLWNTVFMTLYGAF